MKQVNRFFILASAAALVACATAPAPAPGTPAAPAGYYTKLVAGQQMFCRNDLITGSRVEREGEKCYTADELKALQDANAAAINGSLSTQHGTQSVQ
jgi:predicted transglutaminase-like cysteine proteinase